MQIYQVIFATIVIWLLLPAIFKRRRRLQLYGPELSEFKYSEITFENRGSGFKLAGMLFLPEIDRPCPITIIVHGSGLSYRNNAWYLSVVKYLQDSGIAVLLPDKRGSEKSEGEWVGASIEELATDTLSAIEFVKGQQKFEYTSIGLIGMSQGGWIVPVAENQSGDVSFVVSMSGATVTADEQLLHEETNNISSYTYGFIARIIAPITIRRLKRLKHVSALAEFDPLPYWKNVRAPVFMAFGENDKNVPIAASLQRLEENNLHQIETKIYADGGHAIRDVLTNNLSEDYLVDLVKFIDRVVQQG